MLNRPPALATSAGGANAAQRRKRSINRKGTGTLSLPLLSPSAASFGALPGAASPAGGAAALAQGSPMAGGGSGNPMTPMSPMFYSSLLPPASPSVLHLALQIDLPPDHVDALKAVLQVIGNFANAGELHQTAVWDRCFAGTFSRLATVRSPAVQRPLCMVLFTCCRAVPKHVDGLGGSMDGVALLAGALRAQGEALVARADGRDGSTGGDVFSALPDAASNGMDEWLGLLVERLCLRARYFEPVFKNLPNFSPRPALGQVRGLFCPEQAALLWVLWGSLHATAKARGIPGIDLPSASNEDDGNSKGDETSSNETSKKAAAPGSRWQVHGLPDIGPGTLKFLLTACRNAAAGLGKAREESGSKALTSSSTSFTCLQLVLCFSLRCLRVLAAQEPSTTSHPAPTAQDSSSTSPPDAADATSGAASASAGQTSDPKSGAEDAFVAIGGSEIVPLLLDLLQRLSMPRGSSDQEKEEAYPGHRCDLVSVLANACHHRPAYQDAVRMYKCTGGETAGDISGLVLVLRQIMAESGGGSGGGMRDWLGYAVRCLVEGNESNRNELAAAVQSGAVSQEMLEAAVARASLPLPSLTMPYVPPHRRAAANSSAAEPAVPSATAPNLVPPALCDPVSFLFFSWKRGCALLSHPILHAFFPSAPSPALPSFTAAPAPASLPSQQVCLSRTATGTRSATHCLSSTAPPPPSLSSFSIPPSPQPHSPSVPSIRSLPGLPPFTAGAFESHVNRLTSRLPVPVFRSYDTGLPETLFAAVQALATESGAVNMRYKERSRYHIWIADTELEIEYKLICVPNPDNSGIILTKVKHNSLRYAVVDIARPVKSIDFRLLLLKESRLCSLDDATRSACELISSTAVIDTSARGGLLWPDTTPGFDTTLLSSSSSSSAAPPPAAAAATATPTTPPNPSSQSVQPSPSTRFRVMGCWHLDKSRAESGGRLWKLARINGLVAGQVGSSLKHQIDLCPLAWRETTKGHEAPSNSMSSSPATYSATSCFDSSLQQAAPQWTPDSILADCPALIHWLQQHLP
ncbi:unnamed protein product [Closterium sp. Naga37s-1]|nr:unnamed protein product [Closterium sp. Naga37s-1]